MHALFVVLKWQVVCRRVRGEGGRGLQSPQRQHCVEEVAHGASLTRDSDSERPDHVVLCVDAEDFDAAEGSPPEKWCNCQISDILS